MTKKPHTGYLPDDNSWMSFYLLHQRLDDLLTWCRYPHPEPLSEGWLDSVKEGIHAAIEQSLRDVQGNESLAEKLRDTKRLAFRLATQITNCPKLSTVPRREWTVPDDCIPFDKLSKLNEEFGELAKVPKSFRSPGRETALGPSEQRETDRQQTTDSPDLVISAMIAVLAREADRHPPTDSPAQQAVASPSPSSSKPATIQKSSRTGNVEPRTRKKPKERDVDRNRLILELSKTGKKPKEITRIMNTTHKYNLSVGAVGKVILRKSLECDKQDKQDKQDK